MTIGYSMINLLEYIKQNYDSHFSEIMIYETISSAQINQSQLINRESEKSGTEDQDESMVSDQQLKVTES